MNVFCDYIYQLQKGLRPLALHTIPKESLKAVEKRLNREKINYLIQDIDNKKVNVFFGNENCINVIERFAQKKLNEFSPEEDFILGIMLGYDKVLQCERYLRKLDPKQSAPKV